MSNFWFLFIVFLLAGGVVPVGCAAVIAVAELFTLLQLLGTGTVSAFAWFAQALRLFRFRRPHVVMSNPGVDYSKRVSLQGTCGWCSCEFQTTQQDSWRRRSSDGLRMIWRTRCPSDFCRKEVMLFPITEQQSVLPCSS